MSIEEAIDIVLYNLSDEVSDDESAMNEFLEALDLTKDIRDEFLGF